MGCHSASVLCISNIWCEAGRKLFGQGNSQCGVWSYESAGLVFDPGTSKDKLPTIQLKRNSSFAYIGARLDGLGLSMHGNVSFLKIQFARQKMDLMQTRQN